MKLFSEIRHPGRQAEKDINKQRHDVKKTIRKEKEKLRRKNSNRSNSTDDNTDINLEFSMMLVKYYGWLKALLYLKNINNLTISKTKLDYGAEFDYSAP